jgi:hypothetical protein
MSGQKSTGFTAINLKAAVLRVPAAFVEQRGECFGRGIRGRVA